MASLSELFSKNMAPWIFIKIVFEIFTINIHIPFESSIELTPISLHFLSMGMGVTPVSL